MASIIKSLSLVAVLGLPVFAGHANAGVNTNVITSNASPSPDFDGDNWVGFTDFLIFAQAFGSRQGDGSGKYEAKYDLDGDGEIGFGDFLIFAGSFGKEPPSSGGGDGGSPDLVVQSPSVSDSSPTPGQSFTLSATVRNQGTGQSAATTLHYYRSTDATVSTSDTEVGTDAVRGLAAGRASAESINLTAESSEGTYYYGACVESVAGEADTRNNCSAASPAVTVRDSSRAVAIPDVNLRAAIEDALGKDSGAPITPAEMATFDRLDARAADISVLSGIESATNLRYLSLEDNNITSISALSGLTNLGLLELGANSIEDISALSELTNLRALVLRSNPITDISALSGLTNLTFLELVGNDISDVSPLRGLTNLTFLGLGVNNISDVSPLRGLTNLERLVLFRNEITDVSALSGLTDLRELDLQINIITDISGLSGLTSLTHLELRGNPLSDTSINEHIPVLESNGATVRFDAFGSSDFDIELVYLDSFTEEKKRVLQYVARRWMTVIIEDLPDSEFTQGWSGRCGDHSYEIPAGERIDDLRIYVTSFEGDGPLGWGGPSLLRETTNLPLPVLGCMGFNLRANLLITGLHEVGHVLGSGTLWEQLGFYQNTPDGDQHFNGPLAIAAFDDAGGWDYTGKKVPVSGDGGHWRVPVLNGELMEPAGGGALSAITVQSLADLGYGVDVTQADPYTTLPGAGAASELSCDAGFRRAIPVVDAQGFIVRTISSD